MGHGGGRCQLTLRPVPQLLMQQWRWRGQVTICLVADGAWYRVGTPGRDVKTLLRWGIKLQQSTINCQAKTSRAGQYILNLAYGPEAFSSCASSSCSSPETAMKHNYHLQQVRYHTRSIRRTTPSSAHLQHVCKIYEAGPCR